MPDDQRPTTVLLSRQFSDHREQRHIQRNNDAADADAEDADDDRLQHGQHIFGGGIDFVFVKVGDLLEHRVHGAGCFADADHLRDHVREDAAFAQRIDDGAAFFDRFADLHQRFFEYRVARGAGSDGQAFENRNAGGDQRAQSSSKTGDCDLAQQQSHDGQLEQHSVKVIASTRMLSNLLNAEVQADPARDKDPPEVSYKAAHADDDAGGQRKRDAEANERVGENRHHPLQQCGHDQYGERDYRNRVDQCRLDGRAQFDRLFNIDRQALENEIQNTAGFARLDHVGGQVVEDDRIETHGIGERGAAFDGGPNAEERLLEVWVLLVGAEDFQALHERESGVDDDGELVEEHRHILDLDLAFAECRQGKF